MDQKNNNKDWIEKLKDEFQKYLEEYSPPTVE